MRLPDHLSYSQISTYLTCPLRYNFQYMEEIPPAFTGSSLAFGSAIHEAVGAFYQDHLIGECLRPDQMLDIYRQAWSSRQRDEKVRFFNGDNEDSLRDKAQELFRVFVDSFDPSVAVLGIEEHFEINLGDLPPFMGYLDLIEEDTNGQITIADLKTSSRKISDNQAHKNMQLTAYSVGIESLGFDPEQTRLRLDVLTKGKTPELLRVRDHADRGR